MARPTSMCRPRRQASDTLEGRSVMDRPSSISASARSGKGIAPIMVKIAPRHCPLTTRCFCRTEKHDLAQAHHDQVTVEQLDITEPDEIVPCATGSLAMPSICCSSTLASGSSPWNQIDYDVTAEISRANSSGASASQAGRSAVTGRSCRLARGPRSPHLHAKPCHCGFEAIRQPMPVDRGGDLASSR
jgi:hypothetical protein